MTGLRTHGQWYIFFDVIKVIESRNGVASPDIKSTNLRVSTSACGAMIRYLYCHDGKLRSHFSYEMCKLVVYMNIPTVGTV